MKTASYKKIDKFGGSIARHWTVNCGAWPIGGLRQPGGIVCKRGRKAKIRAVSLCGPVLLPE